MKKPVPHKHAEVIKAWADGAEIQIQDALLEDRDLPWRDMVGTPMWFSSINYRVKPRVFPKSSLSYDDLCDLANQASVIAKGTNEGYTTIGLRLAADAAVARYILDTEKET